MAAPKRTSIQIERDRRDIAQLYLKGWIQADIAAYLSEDPERHYVLSQQMISYDLRRVQAQWRESALIDVDEAKSRELAKIDQLEREYWQAWERSCENAETVVRKTKGTVKKYEDGDGQFVAERPAEVNKTSAGQAGDPRFLQGIQWCIDRRCKIIGVDSAKRIRVDGRYAVGVFDMLSVLPSDFREETENQLRGMLEAGGD